jgi:hypothetical protein
MFILQTTPRNKNKNKKKSEDILISLTVLSVLMICHGNRASASARTVLPLLGSLKRFIALTKQKNTGIVLHSFLYREVLVSKSVAAEVREMLEEMIKMVNYITSSSLQSRLFSAPCSAVEAAHTQPLLHTEVRWLSRGRVLSRFCELSEECELADLLSDEIWCSKVAS